MSIQAFAASFDLLRCFISLSLVSTLTTEGGANSHAMKLAALKGWRGDCGHMPDELQ